jgi:predicted oxidoreductase
MALLEARARALPGIAWRLEHRVLDLARSGGRVTGVLAEHAGRTIELSAPAVVIASGGFNNDAELVAEHAVQAASAQRVLLGGGTGAHGDGHRMLRKVGAQFTQLDAVWMYPYGTPDYRHEASGRGLAVRGVDGEIWVNDDGVRFHDEHLRGGATGTSALLAQTNGRGWSVFDSRIASRMIIADPYYTEGSTPRRERVDAFLRDSPYVRSAATPAGLAARMGVDGTQLQAAIDGMNAAIAAGQSRDPEFGKPLAGLSAIEVAPFIAVRLYPMARKNLGGVRTDLDGQVLDTRGRAIPGLFAIGEVAGMAGGHINGRAALEGTAFGPSLFSGIVVGRCLAA